MALREMGVSLFKEGCRIDLTSELSKKKKKKRIIDDKTKSQFTSKQLLNCSHKPRHTKNNLKILGVLGKTEFLKQGIKSLVKSLL